jgi:hypothetical protein
MEGGVSLPEAHCCCGHPFLSSAPYDLSVSIIVHAPSSPRCPPALVTESREARRAAVPSELKQVARHTRPAGDFCSRLFRCSPSLTLNLPKGSHSEQVRCSSRGLCTFYRHAGVIVPPGEPPGGTSPAAMPRRHHGGGAGSSPRNHRHDRCSRWEELTGSMEEGQEAWRKTREEKCQKRKSQRFPGGRLTPIYPRYRRPARCASCLFPAEAKLKAEDR